MSRKPIDPGAAMAAGVEHLLRRFDGLPAAATGPPASSLVASVSTTQASGRAPTIFVVASDATPASKAAADILCDGVDDDIEIMEAMHYVGNYNAGHDGGRVVLSEGNFYCTQIGDSTDYGVKELVGMGKDVTFVRTQQDAPLYSGTHFMLSVQDTRRTADMTIIVEHENYTIALNVGGSLGGSRNVAERLRIVMNPPSDPGLPYSAVYLPNWGVLRDCDVYSKDRGIHIAGTDVMVINNTVNCLTTHGSGYAIYGPSSLSPRAHVVGNNVDSSGTYSIYLLDNTPLVMGNMVAAQIYLGGSAGDGIYGGNITTGYAGAGLATATSLDNVAPEAADVSPLTTKGDLWGFDTVDDRIPAGADDTILIPDSSEGLGVKWAPHAFPVVTSDPASPVEGQVIVNSTENVAKIYHGGAWHLLTGSVGDREVTITESVGITDATTDVLT